MFRLFCEASWESHAVPLCVSHGPDIGSPWATYGLATYGLPIRSTWVANGFALNWLPMGIHGLHIYALPLKRHELHTGHAWTTHGLPMGYRWTTRGLPPKPRALPIGCSWPTLGLPIDDSQDLRQGRVILQYIRVNHSLLKCFANLLRSHRKTPPLGLFLNDDLYSNVC